MNGNGALDDYVTIVAPEGTTLTNVRALEVPGDNPPPDGVRLPYGLFDYDVTVASPGDTADVTYVLPDEGVAPTSVHMLQNGVWTDYADHTSVDSVDGKVTVALRDGGEGDATGTADGVIKDPSGPSTSNQTITVTNASGACGAELHLPARALHRDDRNHLHRRDPGRHGERLEQRLRRQRRARQLVRSWFWGSPTALEYDRNYRLSVVTPLPASGWGLTARNCSPDGVSTTNTVRPRSSCALNDSTDNRRATCTFTFASGSGTITVHKGGTRATLRAPTTAPTTPTAFRARCSSPHLQGANTWSDLCTTNADGDCTSAALSPGTYDVREKSAPAGWSTISQLVFGGNSAGTGNQTHPYVGTATVGTTGSANVAVQRTNTAGHMMRTTGSSTCVTTMPLPATCGITIALVLDRSGSITANRQAYIDAVNGTATQPGLLGSLAGTPTHDQDLQLRRDCDGALGQLRPVHARKVSATPGRR